MVAYNFLPAYIAKKSVLLKSEFEFKLRSCIIYDTFTTIMKICFEYRKKYLNTIYIKHTQLEIYD